MELCLGVLEEPLEASREGSWMLAEAAVAIGEFLTRQLPHERNDWK